MNAHAAITDPIITAMIAAHQAREVFPTGHQISYERDSDEQGRVLAVARCECGATFRLLASREAELDAQVEAHWQRFDNDDDRGQPVDGKDSSHDSGAQTESINGHHLASDKPAQSRDDSEAADDAATRHEAPAAGSLKPGDDGYLLQLAQSLAWRDEDLSPEQKAPAHYEQCVGVTDEWYTPPHIFTALGCSFDLDVAHPGPPYADWIPAKRAICAGSLTMPWRGFVWMNPPFGGRNDIIPWLEKFIEHGNGIALTPDRTSAPWWQKYAPRVDVTLFVSPKIKFIGRDGLPGASPAQGTTLLGIGTKARGALCRAAASGLGLLMAPVIVPVTAEDDEKGDTAAPALFELASLDAANTPPSSDVMEVEA